METQVIERDEEFEVCVPDGQYNLIEPFELVQMKVSRPRTALVILNQLIQEIDLTYLWANCELVVCADGGANQLYDYFYSESERCQYIPQFIVGDMDSLKREVREYYQSKGCRVIAQYTQYASDFMKAMQLAQIYFHSIEFQHKLKFDNIDDYDGLPKLSESIEVPNTDPIEVYVLSSIGGRFDQTIHSINQLYVLHELYPQNKLYLITQHDIIFLLTKGKNFVKYHSKLIIHSNQIPIAGLLPIGAEVILNTQGLKWDVVNWKSSMKGKVSSSNWLMGINGVLIDTTDTIVMNVEFQHNKSNHSLPEIKNTKEP